MADLVNRAQMRKELPRLSGQAFIQSQEVLTSSFRRVGASDYRLAVDDVALLAAINSFATQEKAEDDETQTKLDTINASLGTINTSITTLNANLTTLLNEVKTALGGIDASIDETTAAVNDVNEDTESIDAKMDTANTNITSVKTSVDTVATNVQEVGTTVSSIDTKLDTANTKLDTIAINTTPVVVGVELTGLEGGIEIMKDADPMTGVVMSYNTQLASDDLMHRGCEGILTYNNGDRKPLSASDFDKSKFEVNDKGPFHIDSDGKIYVDACVEGYVGGTNDDLTYTYSPGISTTVHLECTDIAYSNGTLSDVVAHGVDLAHIGVGDTVDFTAGDLTAKLLNNGGMFPTSLDVLLPTKSSSCLVSEDQPASSNPDNTYIVKWESSDPETLAPVDDQPGKFSAIKAGTATITYTLHNGKGNERQKTATFNAVVLAPFPEITLFNGGQLFSPDGSNNFTVNKLDGTNFNWYRIKQDGSFLTGKATADGTVLQVVGSENDELNTLQPGSGSFSIAHGGQTKQFNVNVTDNTDGAPKAFLETDDDGTVDLSESPTIEVSSGQVYSGTVYVRNATSSAFNESVTGSIGSGTLLTEFSFDGSSVNVNPGGNSVVRFTATAKADASSSDSAVVNVSIGDNEYTINFAFRG